MAGFAVWAGIGASVGVWRVVRSAPRQRDLWANLGLFTLLLAIIGARVGYVLQNAALFTSHPLDTLMVWAGGLTWPGAMAGVFLALTLFAIFYRTSRSKRVSIGWISDRLYPMLPPIAILCWLGCWQAGIAYGALIPASGWWGVPSVDETGATLMRVPAQFLAALSLLVFFWVLEGRIRLPRPSGQLAGLGLTGLLVNLLVFSVICADPAPEWNGVRVNTWAALFFLAALFAFFVVNSLFHFVERKWKQREVHLPTKPLTD